MEHDTSRHICYKQFDVPPYKDKNPDGKEVVVEGLKANVYLNLRTRLEELLLLDEKMDAEDKELRKAVEEGYCPPDIKKYNALFMYHKVVINENDGKRHLEYTRNEGSDVFPYTEKLQRGWKRRAAVHTLCGSGT